MARKKAPGRSHRTGMTIIELLQRFPDNKTAERWLEDQCWSHGRFCSDCGSINIKIVASRKPMPYRCRDCRTYFSVRKGTVMQASKIPYQKWVIAIYMMATGIKGTSSMKVYRELGMTQATAWFLMHRIRESFRQNCKPFQGPVEADETLIGGKEKNKHASRKHRIPKTILAGVKDRHSKQIQSRVVENTKADTLQGFVLDQTAENATVYTDESKSYKGIPRNHDTVNHSASEYVKGDVSTNGMESFWSLFKRGYHGTFHHLSEKHLGRYAREFTGRNNIRDKDTLEQMAFIARGFVGKRLTYEDLVA